uniref:Uncharacterized protein n=1 Tax=Rhizophora mucronata TaxID=61149 RepID=A0A2P2NRA4_RHIMU
MERKIQSLLAKKIYKNRAKVENFYHLVTGNAQNE